MNRLTFPPGGLTTRQAFEYVGGRTVFESLREQFNLRPFFKTQKLQVYRREDIDSALARAAISDRPLPNRDS